VSFAIVRRARFVVRAVGGVVGVVAFISRCRFFDVCAEKRWHIFVFSRFVRGGV
jgi:hypothetical protein